MATEPKSIVYYPPSRPIVDRPSVITYGTIEHGGKVWQDELASSLIDLPVAILNPFRKDWDSSWVEDISDLNFKQQVEWEMDHAKIADVICFHFASSTLAPISLLELGMYAGTGKVVVSCHPDFKKKGNVQMVCSRYGIDLVYTLDELNGLVRKRLEGILENRNTK